MVAALLSGGHRLSGGGLANDEARAAASSSCTFTACRTCPATSQAKARALVERLTAWQYESCLCLVPFGEIQREVVLSVPPPLRVVVYRRLMVRIAEALGRRYGAQALVSGESLGQVASQTLTNLARIDEAAGVPILRPLIGMDKLEITAEAKRLGHLRDLDRARRRLLHALHPAASRHRRRRQTELARAEEPASTWRASSAWGVRASVDERFTFPARPAVAPSRLSSVPSDLGGLTLETPYGYGRTMSRLQRRRSRNCQGHPGRDPPPEPQSRADRLRELRLGRRPGGGGLRPHQQVRRGVSRAGATTVAARWWTWSRNWPSPGPRSCSAPSTSTCSRTPGAQANMAVYFTLLKPGDVVLGPNLSHGGHLTAGSPVNYSGKFYSIVAYGVRRDTERVDLDEVRDLARQHRPRLIIAGGSAFPRAIDFAPFGEIAREVGCGPHGRHRASGGPGGGGLAPLAGGDRRLRHDHHAQDPARPARWPGDVPGAATPAALDRTVMPGVQGGPLMHVIAGKAVALREALTPEWKAYQRQIVANARALAEALLGPRVSPGHRRHRHAPAPRGPDRAGSDRQGRPGGPRPSLDHGEQEHDPLRVAQAHGDERDPSRHAGRDHARHARERDGDSLPA